ncbi:MAG: glycosyltransferase family 4 protein [Vicinamibacterales bacterium]
MTTPLRIANFMDSSLEALERKGNLSHALALYNPRGIAEKVIHFTPFPADSRYAGRFAEAGVDVVPFFIGRTRGILGSAAAVPAALVKVVATMRRERITLVRGRAPYFGSLLGAIAGRLLGIPTVVSLGGDNRLVQVREQRYYFGSRWLSFGMEWLVLRLANAIIVPNQFTRDYVAAIIGKRAAHRKATVIPWILERMLDEQRSPAPVEPTALGLDPATPYVLIVGHLNHYKFSREMFDVAADVLARRPGALQFVFCGDGHLRPEGERRFAGVPGVRFMGWQPNETVLGLMLGAAAILIPMSGFVLLEAAALGRPVLVSDIEWHREMVTEGVSGWLLPPQSPSLWVERLIWLLDHQAAAAAAGARLRERFLEAYTPAAAFAAEAQLYARLTA